MLEQLNNLLTKGLQRTMLYIAVNDELLDANEQTKALYR